MLLQNFTQRRVGDTFRPCTGQYGGTSEGKTSLSVSLPVFHFEMIYEAGAWNALASVPCSVL